MSEGRQEMKSSSDASSNVDLQPLSEPKPSWRRYFVSNRQLAAIWGTCLAALIFFSCIPWYFAEFDGPYVMTGVYSSAPLKRREGRRFLTDGGVVDLHCRVSFYIVPMSSCTQKGFTDKEIDIQYYNYKFFFISSTIGVKGVYENTTIFYKRDLRVSMLFQTLIELGLLFSILAMQASIKRVNFND